MVTVDTLLAIDLLGQAVITHLGPDPIGSPGGQLEYTIGAHYSKGGRAISTLLSTAKGGTVSRIVPMVQPGTVVTIPLYYVDNLVTEYGAVNLNNKTSRERAELIISVAHPDFRAELKEAANKMFYP
jgi:acyl-CoA hydrolase